MRNRKALINIVTSAGQVALIGLIYYFLYKFLLDKLGVKLLGVWSVVMSTSSIANVADLGIATSMVRYVAIYEHRGNLKRIPSLIYTGVVLNIIVFVFVCLIIWPIAYFVLGNIIEEKEYLSLARSLLPFSLICVFINSLSGVYGSILDGFRKNYIRNSIYTFSSIVFLLLSLWSVNRVGLIGVVWAQVFQSILSFILCIIFAVKTINFNPFKYAWSKGIFKQIFSYGLKFQLTSITGILNEPVTKMFLSKFGGLAFTGYYEMANKLIMQVRGAIVSANQSLMPYMVKESEVSKLKNRFTVLSLSFTGVLIVSLIILTSINILAPKISEIWIGHNEVIFVNVLFLVSISMFINLLSAPCYFALLSLNKLNPIIYSQTIMATINLALGLILGSYFGGYGIVATWMIVVIAGSLYLLQSVRFSNVVEVLKQYRFYAIILFGINILSLAMSRIFNDFSYIFFSLNTILIITIFIQFYKREKKIIFSSTTTK